MTGIGRRFTRIPWRSELPWPLLLFALFARGSVTILQEVLASGQTSSAMGLPMKYVYSAPLAGFGLGILRMVQHMLQTARALLRPAQEKGGAV